MISFNFVLLFQIDAAPAKYMKGNTLAAIFDPDFSTNIQSMPEGYRKYIIFLHYPDFYGFLGHPNLDSCMQTHKSKTHKNTTFCTLKNNRYYLIFKTPQTKLKSHTAQFLPPIYKIALHMCRDFF
jgi:hypothetical protein